jgi:hypothetical protein
MIRPKRIQEDLPKLTDLTGASDINKRKKQKDGKSANFTAQDQRIDFPRKLFDFFIVGVGHKIVLRSTPAQRSR